MARKGAPPKGGLMVSRAQHRFAFDQTGMGARAAVRGRYRPCPSASANAMSSYATTAQVRALAADLSIGKLPTDDAVLARLIVRASGDVERVIGQRDLDLDALTDPQIAALANATAWQSILIAVQGAKMELGSDDLVQSIPLVSFAPPSRAPRIAPRAVELLARTGLIRRSGTIPPPTLLPPG